VTEAHGRVLVVDDERDLAESCAFFLRRAGYSVAVANSGEAALAALERDGFALVVTDLKMPRMSGLQLLAAIKQRDPDVEVVVITGFPEVETAVEAMKLGALDYVTKPFREQDLMQRVDKAFAHRRLKDRNQALRERLRKGVAGRRLIYRSAAFARTVETVERAARTDASVLIQGESGTGKELLAHHLHDASQRAGRPFVPVDCTTMPETLVESELFGHVRGAFSGAAADKMGLFQIADGGTLFLDEVGEIPAVFQTKLLRAIQEKQIRRVGSNEIAAVDVRIVCATNRNLQREVEAGRFRQDLYYRLDVVRIQVPPLRERLEDVEPLVRFFFEEFLAGNPGCAVRELAPDALAALRTQHWPGNVRQLRNAVERACTLATRPLLTADDLASSEQVGAMRSIGEEGGREPFQEMKARKVAAIESDYLVTLLRRHGGNVTRCAEEAGMARSAFQKLMQRYRIKSSDYRRA
jgi:DNA-binding NtrC family response regulator